MGIKQHTLLSCGRMTVDPSWFATRHSHPFVEVLVINGGQLDVRLGDELVRVTAGDVLTYPPGSPHDERVVGGFDTDFTMVVYKGLPDDHRTVVHDGDGRMRVLASWLLREHTNGYRHRADMLDSILALMLMEYDRLCVTREPTMVDAVRDFLREHLAEPLTGEDLARVAHISRAHFIRTYKRHAGCTPMDDLRKMRIEAARDLIITTDLPLKAIADRVGLGNAYHLSHVFRRVLHVSPGYFRTKH